MSRLLFCLGLLVLLAACGSNRPIADASTVARAQYSDPSPPSLTVMTTLYNSTGAGAHSSLLINASQRVIFDPAGSFQSPSVPQKGDVLFGMSPRLLEAYLKFQSSDGFHVVAQKVQVPPAVAEQALRLALANGPASQGLCTDNVSSLIARLPGFNRYRTTLFPLSFMHSFAHQPGVVTTIYRNGQPTGEGMGKTPAAGPGPVATRGATAMPQPAG